MKIINFAPAFPDVSRQLTSLSTSLITCVIEISTKNSRCLTSSMHCLLTLMSTYPGPCPTNAKNIEALLVRNISQKCLASANQLARCYAMLPRLGGGGQDGINHIESGVD